MATGEVCGFLRPAMTRMDDDDRTEQTLRRAIFFQQVYFIEKIMSIILYSQCPKKSTFSVSKRVPLVFSISMPFFKKKLHQTKMKNHTSWETLSFNLFISNCFPSWIFFISLFEFSCNTKIGLLTTTEELKNKL